MNKEEFRLKVFVLSETLFPMVSRILGNNANAEDAIQEIMMKLWVKRNQLSDHPNVTGFVFLTARNYCLDLMKKKRLEIDYSPFQLEILKSESGQGQLEYNELYGIIKRILKILPIQQREIIIMRDLDGYEFNEIAAATQLKIGHVRVLLSRARKQVGIELKETYNYERR